MKGYGHELETGRFSGARRVSIVVDQSGGPDSIGREDLEREVSRELKSKYGEGAVLENVQEIDSKLSGAIQLADLISGALNRKINHDAGGGIKDELADFIISTLGLSLSDSVVGDDAFRLIAF